MLETISALILALGPPAFLSWMFARGVIDRCVRGDQTGIESDPDTPTYGRQFDEPSSDLNGRRAP